MPPAGKKRARTKFEPAPGLGNTRLVQTHVSNDADVRLRERAAAEASTVAAYVRRVLYRDLGIIKENKPNG